MSISAIEFIEFPGTHTAVVRRKGVRGEDMVTFMDSSFTVLGAAIQAGAFVPIGPAFSRYDSVYGETVDLEAGFPVAEPLTEAFIAGEITVIPSELPAGLLAITKYRGGYDGLGEGWGEFMEGVKSEGYELLLPYWEAYDTEPTPEMDPADLITGLATLVRKSQ